MLWILR
ncbi:hypothetical protein CR513_47137 [Mucuna pruriens]|nr:hypothetical protein CR513_47137 [Mucuna pruriens]